VKREQLGAAGAWGSVRPRRVSGASGRPLNANVRRHGSPHCHACRHLPLRCDPASCSAAAPHGNELQLFDLRRYGAVWAYYKPTSVTIEAPKGGLSKYSWNQRIRDYHRCKRCGCVTHYTYRGRQRNRTIGVNAANFAPSALVGVRIRHLDGAVSWKLLD